MPIRILTIAFDSVLQNFQLNCGYIQLVILE